MLYCPLYWSGAVFLGDDGCCLINPALSGPGDGLSANSWRSCRRCSHRSLAAITDGGRCWGLGRRLSIRERRLFHSLSHPIHRGSISPDIPTFGSSVDVGTRTGAGGCRLSGCPAQPVIAAAAILEINKSHCLPIVRIQFYLRFVLTSIAVRFGIEIRRADNSVVDEDKPWSTGFQYFAAIATLATANPVTSAGHEVVPKDKIRNGGVRGGKQGKGSASFAAGYPGVVLDGDIARRKEPNTPRQPEENSVARTIVSIG